MSTDTLKYIALILGAIAFLTLGYLLKSSLTKTPLPKTEVTEIVKYDTVKIVRRIYVTRTVESKTAGDSIRSYSDSIMGDTMQTKYSISHTILDSLKTIRGFWKVNIEPRFSTIIKTITRDSIQTKINNVYIAKPFFLDDYFYLSVFEAILLTILIIFK